MKYILIFILALLYYIILFGLAANGLCETKLEEMNRAESVFNQIEEHLNQIDIKAMTKTEPVAKLIQGILIRNGFDNEEDYGIMISGDKLSNGDKDIKEIYIELHIGKTIYIMQIRYEDSLELYLTDPSKVL